MENTIRTRRIHFSLLFDWKSDLGQSWRHLRDILGRLGKIFQPSWPSTWVHLGPQDGSWAAQEPPERSLQNTQEASWSQEPPKSRPEPSKTPQGGAQTPSKPRFSRKHGGGNAALPRWRYLAKLTTISSFRRCLKKSLWNHFKKSETSTNRCALKNQYRRSV